MHRKEWIVVSLALVALAIGTICMLVPMRISAPANQAALDESASQMVIEPWVEANPIERTRHAQAEE